MVSCRLSATGIRFSVIRFPPGSWALLTVGLPAKRRTPTGYRVPHARAATGVGALYTPRTAVLIPADRGCRPAPAASQRPVPAPGVRPIGLGSRITRHQRGFKQFTRPGLPQACGRPDGTSSPWADASGFVPRRPKADNARQGGDRPSSTNLELPLNSHPSISNPILHSMRATSRRTPRLRSPGRRDLLGRLDVPATARVGGGTLARVRGPVADAHGSARARGGLIGRPNSAAAASHCPTPNAHLAQRASGSEPWRFGSGPWNQNANVPVASELAAVLIRGSESLGLGPLKQPRR
jgi:hypothetical protein